MPRIVANMVIRNEVDRYLEDVLEHLKPQVDDIVITDDCSDDDSVLVARKYTNKVISLAEPTFVKDESLLRTTAWEHLSSYAVPGDWILAIDADEKFYPDPDLPRYLEQTMYPVLGVSFFHMWNEKEYRIDKAWKPNVSSRLFRFKLGGQFRRSRLACGSEPTYVNDYIRAKRWNPQTGLRMQHLGYQRDDDKIAKFERYITLDGGDFHAIQHIRSILDHDPVLLPWKG